jgi:hypothetical protein
MKILLYDFNNILVDVRRELIKRGHTMLPQDGKDKTWKTADVIVLWNETPMGGWTNFVKRFKAAGVRSVLMQHGRRGTSRIFPPFNEPLNSDVICSWGENDRKRMLGAGIDPKRVKVTGTTIFSHLKPRIPHEGFNVVFSPEHWDIDVAENFIINSQLAKLKGVKVISKLLYGEHTKGIYPNPVWSDRKEEGHLEICADVLATADLVVAVSESTFELCAEYLDIPVVIADIWTPKPCGGDEKYREYTREYSPACTRVKDMSKLNETILYHLKHPELLRAERKEICILDGGVNIENPLEEIIKVIEHGTNN